MWTFFNPVRVVFGEGELQNISTYAEQFGLNKILLVSDPFHYHVSGLAQRVMELCGEKVVGIYHEVEPNPSTENVNSCKKLIVESGAEGLIAIGGGSSIDCAKAAAGAAKMNCSAEDLVERKVVVTESYPFIAAPTTAGTGSEVTSGCVITHSKTHEKIGVVSDALFARAAIVDPELTYSVPPKVTASSGMDVLAHALDSLCSKKANELTVPLALEAAGLAFQNLETACKNGTDRVARRNMAQASCIIGIAMTQTGTAASHACSYYLTSEYGIPHGEACGFTLDSWVEFSARANPVINDYAKQLGFENAKDMAAEIGRIRTEIGLRSTLSEVGVDTGEKFEKLCQAAISPKLATNVGDITENDLREVFGSKW